MNKVIKNKLSYVQIIAFTFLLVILIGSLLLMLPFSTKNGQPKTNFIDAVFTSVSATCVTGLVTVDTFTHWTVFGQLVILMMIQIGGLGLMSILSMVFMFFRKNFSLHDRKLMMQSASMFEIGSVVRIFRRILLGTAFFELSGTIILCTQFCPEMGLVRGLYNALFHSVSAFCNAGFDILGGFGGDGSLSHFGTNPVVLITIALLVIIGGIGFVVWEDIYTNRYHLSKYKLHTKIVLSSTAILIVGGTALFYIFENNDALSGMTFGNKLLSSFFQSVTPRTAGFAAFNLNNLSDSGRLLTDVLMFIGGSPGSTAGGIKTVTVTVIIFGTLSLTHRTGSVNVFKRRLDDDMIRQAMAIFTTYFIAVIVSSIIICAIEPFEMSKVLFESVSAIGTVGLSLGITSQLTTISKLILMIMMFGGRIGAVTLLLLFSRKKVTVLLERPVEKISLG